MPQLVSTLLSTLSVRVRDPQRTATSTADMRYALSQAQRIVNAQHDAVTVTETFPLVPQQCIYSLSIQWPAAVRVLGIRHAGRDLIRIPYESLRVTDESWVRRQSARPYVWGPLGRDLILIHPSVLYSVNVDVRYTKWCTELTGDDMEIELDDEHVAQVLDLATLIILTKVRSFAAFNDLLNYYRSTYGGTDAKA